VTATRFTAKFGRKCDRCGWRIRPGHAIYRLKDGTELCHNCAYRQETGGEPARR
jgi:hypothetical protein